MFRPVSDLLTCLPASSCTDRDSPSRTQRRVSSGPRLPTHFLKWTDWPPELLHLAQVALPRPRGAPSLFLDTQRWGEGSGTFRNWQRASAMQSPSPPGHGLNVEQGLPPMPQVCPECSIPRSVMTSFQLRH
uniref:Uncharacterized protein n=1 Tax=Molossus molossus TaxID=27622 RepID=A0A7J8GKN2_MOLMO|nr:hypothetical protein HJG59_011408 [Molossus molossus]